MKNFLRFLSEARQSAASIEAKNKGLVYDSQRSGWMNPKTRELVARTEKGKLKFVTKRGTKGEEEAPSKEKTDKKPEIKANIDVKATNQKDTNVFEIELNINVAAIQNEKNVYLIDLKYVGIFEIENLTDDIREPYLLVECPRLIFPFARRIIYDLHADGGLPPLLLDPVNFAKLYQQKKDVKNESIN